MAGKDVPGYLDTARDFRERARDLVSRMTLEEKASQLRYDAPEIRRLGVPSYNWWNEALHGVARAGTATVFPQAIGMAATFDAALVQTEAEVISTEARARFHEFQRQGDQDIYKGLSFWSPNINIFRDPRWGRGHETFGEDPYLTGLLGKAFIRGLQGEGKYLKTAACAKHFAVHSGPEGLRHEFNAEVSEHDLRDTYLPAFSQCVRETGVESVMGAYNRVNGEPCCGSKTLLVDILRGQWGFQGHVVSDCWALKDFHTGHHVTADISESAALAMNSGCDLNCGTVYQWILAALRENLITEDQIDTAAVRLMTTRLRLGLFDPPEQVPYAGIAFTENDSPAHRELSLALAEKTLVLLKNEGGLLPLDQKKLQSVAVIGPNADSREALMGNYHGTASRWVTVLEGIQDLAGDDLRVYYAQGCHLYKDKTEDLSRPGDRIAEAVGAAAQADIAVVCLGLDGFIEGEEADPSYPFSGDKQDLSLRGDQLKLLQAVQATGTPVVLVMMTGSAMDLRWADSHVPAIVQVWYPGQQGGAAVARLLFGAFSPSGRLPVTFYRDTEKLPDFTDYAMQGRTYRYLRDEALYPFGFGLSYTRFSYETVSPAETRRAPGEEITVKARVQNTGSRPGEECVQLYVRAPETGCPRPNFSLRGVQKVFLDPGQGKDITFTLQPHDLSLIDNDGNRMLFPGRYEVFVFGGQPDGRTRKLLGTQPACFAVDLRGEQLALPY